MHERWKAIAGYEGLYEVSDLGRVRSLDRLDSRGNKIAGRVRRQGRMKSGHMNVTLCKEGKQTAHYVHRLVLEAFVGPCPEGMEALHRNGRPGENDLLNLRWGTSLENAADATAHGTVARGEKNGSSKLTEDNVREIRMRSMMEEGHANIAAYFGVCRNTISKIVTGKSWSHVQ